MTQPTQSDSLMRKDNMLLYTDTIQGKQVLRDDMWAITTDELKALEQEAVLRARIEEHISYKNTLLDALEKKYKGGEETPKEKI